MGLLDEDLEVLLEQGLRDLVVVATVLDHLGVESLESTRHGHLYYFAFVKLIIR